MDSDDDNGDMLRKIRAASLETLQNMLNSVLSLVVDPPTDFLAALDVPKRLTALKMCMLLWEVSSRKVFPRKFQLEVALAMLEG
jgi:hypothetical protein